MPLASDLAPEGPDEILAARLFAAPRALVHEARTTPQHLAAGWGPPDPGPRRARWRQTLERLEQYVQTLC